MEPPSLMHPSVHKSLFPVVFPWQSRPTLGCQADSRFRDAVWVDFGWVPTEPLYLSPFQQDTGENKMENNS